MIGVRPEGCICEHCSEITPNWRDMRSELGYETLSENIKTNIEMEMAP
jgi:hypothetical protein